MTRPDKVPFCVTEHGETTTKVPSTTEMRALCEAVTAVDCPVGDGEEHDAFNIAARAWIPWMLACIDGMVDVANTNERLREENDRLRAENAKLLALVREAEWNSGPECVECPWCDGHKVWGHTPNCPIKPYVGGES